MSNSLQLYDCSWPGSSVHGILQARILEWVAISSSRGSSQPRDCTQISCIDWQILYHWATREGCILKLYTCNYIHVYITYSTVHFSRSVVSNSLWPHESQHARPLCPSPTSRVYSNTCPLSRWCHPAISSSVVPFSSSPPIPPSIRVFSSESTLLMRWPKDWSFSFSISPSNEHPGLISFRMDWLDLLTLA